MPADPIRTRTGLRAIRVDRLIYTTVMLMSVLVVYDGWATLTFGGVVAVIVGPILAIFVGHLYGAGVGTRVELARNLTMRERRAVFVDEARFLLILVPPIAIVVVLTVLGVSYTRTIQVVVAAGVLSLGFWGYVAGRRAGLTGWALVGSVVFGLLVGSVVLALQAVLRPGEVSVHSMASIGLAPPG